MKPKSRSTKRKSAYRQKPASRYAAACHEAGHAVAALSLGSRMQQRGIILYGHKGATYTETPVLRRRNGGQWEYHREWLRFTHRAAIVRLFAGPIAESRVTGDLAHVGGDAKEIIVRLRELLGRKSQLAKACNYKKHGLEFEAIVYVLAIPPSTVKKAMSALDAVDGRGLIDAKILQILVSLAKDAHDIIEQNWPSVESIATELVKKGQLTGPEIEKIVSRHRRALSLTGRQSFIPGAPGWVTTFCQS